MTPQKWAVCLLLEDEQGQVLAISRPHSRDDLGLIGGGVEPEDGDIEADREGTLLRAMVREAREEAGLHLDPAGLQPVFSAMARTRQAVTFRYRGDPGTPVLGQNEEGWVCWVPPERILTGSFGDYNRALLAEITPTESTDC